MLFDDTFSLDDYFHSFIMKPSMKVCHFDHGPFLLHEVLRFKSHRLRFKSNDLNRVRVV